ncbi:MarR family winged helix-turn-helix transcriptional regulator [Paenibacillus monticola]|uniref:MarR family transcriptional regulator n=1 Tax=Paenibacillus monticola TaxID=2666075 RepID=A0A7X2H831_9BACL|nr:MarR family transcriptional regulator [Paenibacillus monticola]MRN55271.1 MarR family transcriptional regulator [Paenibacillus monticola]
MEKPYEHTELIGYAIIKGEVLIKRKLLGVFMEKGYDLTFEQWTVLNVLYAEPGLIQSEIALRTFKDKTNVTRILDVLSKKGYIAREEHDKDRRSYCIYLTDSGKEMFSDLIPDVQLFNEQFREGISDEELVMFQKVLEKICKNAE